MLLFSMLTSDLEERLNTISGDHGSALSFVIAVGKRREIRYASKSHCWNPKVWNPLEETLKRERIR